MERQVAPNPAPSFAVRHLRRSNIGREGIPGRRSATYSAQGAAVRAVRGGHGLHLVGSILAAAGRGARVHQGVLEFQPKDLRGQLRRGREANLIVFVVDASGSMAARDRLVSVSGAVRSILVDAYQRRDKVAVISVRGSAPELLVPPTGSIEVAMRRMATAQTGGRTPLAEGLMMAHEVIERQLHKEPGRRALLVVLTDGKATGAAGLDGLWRSAEHIYLRRAAASLVIDCEKPSRVRLGLAEELGRHLGGACVRLPELSAASVTGAIGLGISVG